ncbi:pyruvate kinase [Segnochrobactrum spirostomi]|uniref:Pyruvate kinase n=1 Tax=Segnochrobactrum spirostomi TaxID=2608987 RepID=A0A6A7Y581_9HYPH|nr:pyruvate kinase [Segnochrobactrum spirostomi]MQT14353.1 pyruvate kinase [Segnochrobactrum spirostomi]
MSTEQAVAVQASDSTADNAASEIGALMDEVLALRDQVATDGAALMGRFGRSDHDAAIGNLAHYMSLRHRDLRPLQHRLMWRGLSSLGRIESRVLPTLDAVLCALAAMAGRQSPHPAPSEAAFFAGELRLANATDHLFGVPRQGRRSRIMVTLPSEAATDREVVFDLARRGMDIARINCAHDDHLAWRAMAANVRAAGEFVARRLTILMDIAGPKIRTETIVAPGSGVRLMAGDAFRLVAKAEPYGTEEVPFCAAVSLPEMVNRLSVGDRLRYDDGKLEGTVESVGDGEAIIRVARTKAGGTKLKSEKGINLPDTALGLSPLTDKDERDLATVVECADMVGYSFVSRPDDIDLLEEALARQGKPGHPIGLVAKIERPEAVKNLPDLIARASGRRPFAVMIARGDLAAEIGFERLAEMQEEILWICEAAGVPAIWATQVLEELVKHGVPSRGEMTDAAMAGRAECVMLNKGPEVGAAVDVLDRLLTRMDAHVFKKTSRMRALKSW